MSDTLSYRQYAVFAFVRQHFLDSGRAPTLRQIADHVGLPWPSGAVCHLHALVKKGLLRRIVTRDRPGKLKRSEYFLTRAEIVVEPTTGGGIRLASTGPVRFTPDTWKAWLRERLAELEGAA